MGTASDPSHVNTRRRLLLAAAPLAASAFSGGARAAAAGADYPTRQLTLVCPFPAGGSADTVSRLAAHALAAELGQSVVVENKAGAGGNIAADYVARAPADGYTLLVAGQAILAINKPLYRKLPYDAEKQFRFVSMIASMPNVLVINPKTVPVAGIKEFVAYVKAHPGDVSYGSNGVGSLSHLTTEMLAKAGGMKFLHVPYKGSAPLMVDLVAGRLGFCFTGSALAAQMVKEGSVKALAVTTSERIRALADVPTLVESGFPELNAPSWFSIVAPSGVKPEVFARLSTAMARVTASPDYIAALDKAASIVEPMDPAAGEARLKRERAFWTEAVTMTGATAHD